MSNAQQILPSPSDTVIGALHRPHALSRAARYLRRDRRKLTVGALLLGGDLLAIGVALFIAKFAMAAAIPASEAGALTQPPIALLVLIFLTFGLYSGSAQCPYSRFRMRGLGTLLFVGVYLVGAHGAAPAGGVTLQHLVLAAVGYGSLLLVCGFYVELTLRRVLISTGLWMAPTVLVGDDAASRRLYETFSSQPELGFRPVGFVVNPSNSERRDTLPGPIVGNIDHLSELDDTVEVAVLTSGDQMDLVNRAAVGSPNLQYILLNSVSNMPTLWLSVRPLGSGVGIQVERDPYLCQNHKLKRAMDLALAVPFGILVLPLIGLLALLVWMVDGGSPFYAQQRVGAGGRTFKIPKLRTMYRDAPQRLTEYLEANPKAKEEWQRYFKLRDDPRVLPIIGNFIRRSSLDELPQLWSVIVGDMSLVGPRPFPNYHLSCFDAEFQRMRCVVPPGLTGLWQVTDRSDGDLGAQQLQDTFYIRNWSIWLDLYILLMTPPAVAIGSGAR